MGGRMQCDRSYGCARVRNSMFSMLSGVQNAVQSANVAKLMLQGAPDTTRMPASVSVRPSFDLSSCARI